MLNKTFCKFRLKLWLYLFSGFMFIFTIFLGSSIYNPDILKLLIQAGLPLNYLSGLPVLGDAIRAAEAPQISVQKLKQLIDNEDKNLLLIDVRSPEEYEYGSIPTAILVPLTDIEQGKGIDKIKSLIPGHKLVTYCSKGPRSNKALELLRKAGIEGANLQGGIYEWRAKIDPSMPEP